MRKPVPPHAETQLLVESMVSQRTKAGIVVLTLGKEQVQLPTEQARAIGSWMIECAEAADSDAQLVAFLTGELEMELSTAVQMLRQFRAFRDKQKNAPKGMSA